MRKKIGDSSYVENANKHKNNKRGKLLTDITQIKNITNDMTSRYGKSPSYAFIRDVSTNLLLQKFGILDKPFAIPLRVISKAKNGKNPLTQ